MVIRGVEIDNELIRQLVPGAQVRFSRGLHAPDNELRHIRAIVDEDNVVYCVWWKHHRRWEYKVEWMYMFHLDWKQGWLTFLKTKDAV